MAKPTPGSSGHGNTGSGNTENSLSSKYIASCAVCKTLIFFKYKHEFDSFNIDPFCDEECTYLALQNLSCADSTPSNKKHKK
jgi:hypothetical protein